MFDKLGLQSSEVQLQVSFGREVGQNYWSNVFPTDVIDKFSLVYVLSMNGH